MKVSCAVSKVSKSATVGGVMEYEPSPYYMYARSSGKQKRNYVSKFSRNY